MDMETASPAVSPSVVAATFMIQKVNVTAGTLLRVAFLVCSTYTSPIIVRIEEVMV